MQILRPVINLSPVKFAQIINNSIWEISEIQENLHIIFLYFESLK